METISLQTINGRGLRRVLAFLIALVALGYVTLLMQEPAHAGDSYTWTGEGNGTSWTDACNWWPQGECQQKYPGKEATDDTATIQGLDSGPSAVTLGENMTLASLNLGRGPTGASVTGGSFTLNRGLGWTGGTLKTKVTLTANAVGTISGSQEYKELNGEFNNGGRLILDSGTLSLANAAKIENTGTFSIAKGSKVYGLVCCLTPPTINSTGTIEVGSSLLPGPDTATIDNISLKLDNIVDVGGGTLEVRWAPGRIDAGTAFIGDGTFRVTNKADMAMAGTFSLGDPTDFELDSCSGTCNQASLSGKGTMNGPGQFMWKGGDVDGELTLGQRINTYINGPAPKDLDGKITNIGRTVFEESAPTAPPTGQLRFGAGSSFTNQNIFIARERTEMVGTGGCCLPPAANFVNTDTGFFTAAGSSGTPEPHVATVRSMGFRAGGTVYVVGKLDLTDGAATLPTGASITGTGSVMLTEGQTMAMSGAFTVAPDAELEIGSCTPEECTAGRLEGAGTLGGGGSLKWASGYFGTGRTGAIDELTIASGSKMALTGQSPKQLLGKITNRGTATFTAPAAPATQTLSFGTNGKFVNAATLRLGNRAVLQSGIGCCGDSSADLVNLGKLSMPKSSVPSTGTVTIDSLIFENRGTVDLASGTLRLGRLGAYNQLSGGTLLTGGKISSDGMLMKLMGGDLRGTGTIAANVQNVAGTVAPGAPGTAGSTGILKVTDNYTHPGDNAVLKLDLKGTTPGTGFDQLQVGGEAFISSGTLDLDTATGFAPGTTTKLKVLTAGRRTGSGFARTYDRLLPNGRKWYEVYHSTDITLGVREA